MNIGRPIAFFAVLIAFGAALGVEARSAGGMVSVPEDASLQEALAALHQARGGLVISEIPEVPRRLPEALNAAPQGEALDAVTDAYHLHAIERGEAVVFIRRYEDPRETPLLEPEEYATISATLSRLLNAAAPPGPFTEDFYERRRFVRSLTSEQLGRLEGDGLPFQSLRADQQDLFRRVCLRQGYGTRAGTAERVARTFANWKRSEFAWEDRTRNNRGVHEPVRMLSLRHPAPPSSAVDPWARVLLRSEGDPLPDPVRIPEEGFGPSGERREARGPLPRGFDRPVRRLAGDTTVGDLVRAVEAATGARVLVATHLRIRPLLAFGEGRPARELVAGLEDLYGWSLRSQGGGRWTLGPPRTAPVRNAVELHEQVRAALPPALHDAWALQTRYSGVHRARQVRGLDPLFPALQAAGGVRVKTTDLSPEDQSRLAYFVFTKELRPSLEVFTHRPLPYSWLAAPEEGWFRVMHPPAMQEGLPMITFHARRPDGAVDMWGWTMHEEEPQIIR
jgi:hypothetical protein